MKAEVRKHNLSASKRTLWWTLAANVLLAILWLKYLYVPQSKLSNFDLNAIKTKIEFLETQAGSVCLDLTAIPFSKAKTELEASFDSA